MTRSPRPRKPTTPEQANFMVLALQAVPLLEFDAASYDLSARFGKRKGYIRTMQAKERERRKLVERIKSAAARGARGKR